MKGFLRVILAAAQVGLVGSAAMHVGMLIGIDAPEVWAWTLGVLFAGCVVTGLCGIWTIQEPAKGYSDDKFWREVLLPACPRWMRVTFYVLTAYTVLLLALTIALLGMTEIGSERTFGLTFSAGFASLYFASIMLLHFRLVAADKLPPPTEETEDNENG